MYGELAVFTFFTTIVSIAFGILTIILFFKVWKMTNNVDKLTKHFCKEEDSKKYENTNNGKIDISEVVNGTFRARGITYVVDVSSVIFSDGVEGKIQQSTRSHECSIIVDDNKELVYQDIYYACEALYEYLTKKDIRKDGLIDK